MENERRKKGKKMKIRDNRCRPYKLDARDMQCEPSVCPSSIFPSSWSSKCFNEMTIWRLGGIGWSKSKTR